MTDESVRRLAAIVSADVAGFSKLMGEDEDGTLAALKAHRVAVDPLAYSHGGRIVGTAGDAILFEFPSVTEAVQCSVDVQSVMAERNVTVPEGRRMAFRIGINLGDVIVTEGGDIFGDGVNIAARIQASAEPGGVSVSGSVYDSVKGKIEANFTDTGAHQLKNITEPVRIWQLDFAAPAAAAVETDLPRRDVGPAAVVVLPFESLSPDAAQDYLVDGITEDVITALAGHGEFRVVARNSAFAYRGKEMSDRDVARELDATYVLRGSARVSSERVRVSVQLIDAETGHLMWAERFDRDLEDVFELQDEIAQNIAGRMAPEVARGEATRSLARRPGSLESWDLFHQGRWHYYQTTQEHFETAIELLGQAIEADPGNGPARVWLATVLPSRIMRGWSSDVAGDWELVRELDTEAVRLDDRNWAAHSGLAHYYAFNGRYERSIAEAEAALPWEPRAMGVALWHFGDHRGAIDHFMRALQRSPHEPDKYHTTTMLAYAHYMARNYPAALSWAEQTLQDVPHYVQAIGVMAATLGQLERHMEARQFMDNFLDQLPGMTASNYRSRFNFKNEADLDHYMEGLRRAGMPG